MINQEELVNDAIKNKTVIKDSSTESAKGKEESRLELSSTVSPSLPWYMEGGLIRPGYSEATNEKERKMALFPDEAPGEDRIASKNLVMNSC